MVRVDAIIKFLDGAAIKGGPDYVYGIAPVSRAKQTDLTFAKNIEMLMQTGSEVIICPRHLIIEAKQKASNDSGVAVTINRMTLIGVDNPRLAFLRTVKEFFPIPGPKITIGNNVYLGQGVILGEEGFGYERNEKGELEHFPHLGGVMIQDNVSVFANTCIARGSLDDTVIGEGTKIDQLVHISHGVKVGKHCLITAQAFIGGSTEVGDFTEIWAGAIIKDNITIGHHAVIGAGAVVLEDVAPYQTVASPIKAVDIKLLRK